MLNRLSLAAFALALLLLGGAAQAQWQTLASRDGGFSVMMPGKAKYQSAPQSTAVGNLTMHMWVLDQGNVAYVVMYADYPASRIKSAKPGDVLDGAMKGASKNATKIIYTKKVTLSGYPGREVKFNTSVGGQNAVCIDRMFLVRNRLYQAICVMPANGNTGDMDKFVNSFKLSGR